MNAPHSSQAEVAHACDCAHHRAQAKSAGERPAGIWASLVPILACLVCPACLSAYAKIASFLGIGFSLSEDAHHGLLVAAVLISLEVSGWRSWRLRRMSPVLICALGCALLLASHELEDNPVLMWSGILVLVGGSLWERHVYRAFLARIASHQTSARPG